jgi:hypothetical protein
MPVLQFSEDGGAPVSALQYKDQAFMLSLSWDVLCDAVLFFYVVITIDA